MEIVSGHHRVRAAKEAGVFKIPILLDTTGLSRSAIAAKQLAHNFLVGYDDKDIVDQIAKIITDVDDMLESYLENSKIEVQDVDVGSLLNPSMNIDWKEVSFLFLRDQFDKFKELVSEVGPKDFVGVSDEEKAAPFVAALNKFQKYSDIHSIGMAVSLLTRKALEEVTGAGYEDDEEWQPISACTGGGGSLPKCSAAVLRHAIDSMIKDGLVDKKKRWQGLVRLAEYYITNKESLTSLNSSATESSENPDV
jgi:hypothetical protein